MESSPKISFDNLENAFASKSNQEISQAYWLFKLIGYPKLVALGSAITGKALDWHLPVKGIVKAKNLSHAVMKNIKQNLFFAFIYNVLGIPIAAGVLFPVFGLLLSPMIAALAMSFSSVSVIANALQLSTIKI